MLLGSPVAWLVDEDDFALSGERIGPRRAPVVQVAAVVLQHDERQLRWAAEAAVNERFAVDLNRAIRSGQRGLSLIVMLEPAAEDDLGDVLIGMVAHAVEGACAGQSTVCARWSGTAPPWVEELDGRGLSPQELVRVVEVLEGLCDQPLGVVVELFVLVSGNDVPGEGKMRLVW